MYQPLYKQTTDLELNKLNMLLILICICFVSIILFSFCVGVEHYYVIDANNCYTM